MSTHADKAQDDKSQSVANTSSQKYSSGESAFQFEDNRAKSIQMRQLQESTNTSPRVQQLKAIQDMADNSPKVSQLRSIQDMADNSPRVVQPIQLQAMADNYSTQQEQPIQRQENNTGLPDNLKTGMENLSGMSLADVKVHRNSNKPAQLQAHAYAQGADIHLASGQEKHLPHEAWHVVQQKQGRVKPTMQMKGKVNVNDDAGLEREADLMGIKSLQLKNKPSISLGSSLPSSVAQKTTTNAVSQPKYFQNMANNSLQFKQTVQLQAIVQRMFSVGAQNFKNPEDHEFTPTSALQATKPIPRGEAKQKAGRSADDGVEVGDVGSYGYVQYLEKTGDALTGDHQPSGAAVKENIRLLLHTSLNQPLTRSMAKNAYKKAITIVMTDVWHKLSSRTYGGNNTKSQIILDANNLVDAAIKDWETTVDGLKDEGFTDAEIEDTWDNLCAARKDFFASGNAQVGSLEH